MHKDAEHGVSDRCLNTKLKPLPAMVGSFGCEVFK